MTRLQQLQQLAARVAAEIDAERSSNARIAALAARQQTPTEPEPQRGEIQAWMRANGHALTKSGKVPLKIRFAWHAAHEGAARQAKEATE